MYKPMNKRECLAQGLKWTPLREKKYNEYLLMEKRQVFKELRIPFPTEIEVKFYAAINNGSNAEIYLDNICRSYINYAYENYAKILREYILAESESKLFTKNDIIKLVGKDGLQELCKAGMVRLRIADGKTEMYEVK